MLIVVRARLHGPYLGGREPRALDVDPEPVQVDGTANGSIGHPQGQTAEQECGPAAVLGQVEQGAAACVGQAGGDREDPYPERLGLPQPRAGFAQVTSPGRAGVTNDRPTWSGQVD
jgi:hypothetical protein